MGDARQAGAAILGGTIGFFVGGPTGALYGFQAGLLVGSALFPTQLPGVEGPRLEDFEQLHADPGAPVWRVWGTVAVPGFRMYLGPTREVTNTETVGGKGPPEQDVTTFEYFQTIALGLCEGPISDVLRIWENGELVYDVRPQQDDETSAEFTARLQMSQEYGLGFTLYRGDEEQTADVTLESELGEGNVPAFRGLAYIVWPERELKPEQGNRHPVFKVEVSTVSLTAQTATVIFNNPETNGQSANNFVVPEGITKATVVLIAGGGGGGSASHAGGGGGGGYRVIEEMPLTPLATMPAIVGQGGSVNGDGGNSSFGGETAIGGGKGGSAGGAGSDGGSGGGGSRNSAPGGSGTPGQGHDGGTATPPLAVPEAGGGGGGAGSPGEDAATGPSSGHGGQGIDLSHIVGTSLGQGGWFCGGGAGNRGLGGQGGGGDAGRHGQPGTGGGGGGNQGLFGEGTGGRGMVWIQYVTDPPGADKVTLAEILTEICAAVGLEEIDVSDHVDTEIDGYALTRAVTARGAIEPLRMVGLFDVVERGEQLRFPVRGGSPVATLEDEALGPRFAADAPTPKVSTHKLQDVELPRRIRLRYPSLSRDYESGEQLSPSRIGTVGVNEVTIEVPVVLDDTAAARIAEIMFREAWVSRWTHESSVDASHHALEAADVVLLPVEERFQRVRIRAIRDVGLLVRALEMVRDDDGAYVSQAVATPPPRPGSSVTLLGQTTTLLLDLPPLKDEHNDSGLYAASRRTGIGITWPGARLRRSTDGGTTFVNVAAFTEEAVVGTVTDPAEIGGDGYTWDNDRHYVVSLFRGELHGRTEAAVLAGANAAAVGADGRWHVFQFQHAVQLEPGQYRLSRLLLGRRGTEHLIDTVQAGDAFVLLSGSGIYRVPLQLSEVGAARLYRSVTVGAPLSSANTFALTGQGMALRPFSPVRVRGARDESDNLTITWLRRDRLSQTLRSGVLLPLSEDEEAYEVEILDDYDQVVRTVETSTPQAEYSAAEQTADFGSPQPFVAVRIFQLSAAVGRGTPVEALV